LKELTEIDQKINSAERKLRKLEEKKSLLLKKIYDLPRYNRYPSEYTRHLNHFLRHLLSVSVALHLLPHSG
jgi:vacuolar-type H+-ATPase subunit D/Vma8